MGDILELLDYLRSHYMTRAQLLQQSGMDEAELQRWQAERCMPQPSYRLKLGLECQSFFGLHESAQAIEFNAKEYAGWLGMLGRDRLDEGQAYRHFAQRYRERLAYLAKQGLRPRHLYTAEGAAKEAAMDAHVQKEWHTFLDGTYGLCTKSGLPEDIADKEVGIALIDDITDRQAAAHVEAAQALLLAQAIALLDGAASAFAPHERERSSRRRCIEGVREKYDAAIQA